MIDKLLKEITGGFNIIDIGCRGELNVKWKPVESLINLFGFDPNKEECERLIKLPHNYLTVKYYPYAIAGENGLATMYKTKSVYCYSLLKPDSEWLRRFSFHEHLELVGQESLPVTNLNSLNEFQGLDVDGLKIDAQGLELEILKGADTLLDSIIYAETESGFTPNYINESTQSQVDEYMRSKGFLLFDLIVSRMTYDNLFKDTNNDHGQLLWSESVWLRDYISLHKKNKLSPDKAFNREKALKILAICALQQCIDYGLELAKIFHELGLINLTELKALENQNAWRLTSSDKDNEERKQKSSNRAINFLLRLLPGSTRKLIAKEAHISVQDKHILKSF